MSATNDPESQSLRHLHALRSFVGNLVEQADKSGGCECHKPPSLLLVGPPGAGKTYLVKQMSKVCEMPLFGVHTHQIVNGECINKLFSQARENYPSLVFLDDVDTIFADHERGVRSCTPLVQQIREEIFTELGPRKLKIQDPNSTHNPAQQKVQSSPGSGSGSGSGSSQDSSRSSSLSRPRPSAPDLNDSYDESLYPDNNGIIVVAATSNPWLLYKDHELLSRFRGVYLVGLPDQGSRYTLLRELLREVHHTLSDDDIMEVAAKTQGFTPADLMVVMKTLSYSQFSFLLSATNGNTRGSEGNSTSGSPTPTSSDLTETGSDTDIDGLSEPKKKTRVPSADKIAGATATATATGLAALAAAATLTAGHKREQQGGAANNKPHSHTHAADDSNNTRSDHMASSVGEGLLSRVAAAGVTVAAAGAVAAALQHDWSSDSEDEDTGMITQRERTFGRSSAQGAATPRLDEPDGGSPARRASPRVGDQQRSSPHPGHHQQRSPRQENPSDEDRHATLPSTDRDSDSVVVPPHNSQTNSDRVTGDDDDSHDHSFNKENSRQTGTGSECTDYERERVIPHNSSVNYNQLVSDSNREHYPSKRYSFSCESSVSHSPASIHNDTTRSSSSHQDTTNPSSPHETNLSNTHNDTSISSARQTRSRHSSPDRGADRLSPHQNNTSRYSPHHSYRSASPATYSQEGSTLHEVPCVTDDGEIIDATGCTETEEIVVHSEFKKGPSSLHDELEAYNSNTNLQDISRDDGIPKAVSHHNATDDRSVELHYSEPPEPMRDDNLAIDSDSDNESPVLRPRRVGFSSRPSAIDPMSGDSGDRGFSGGRSPAMNPLTIDCSNNDMPPNISLDALGGSGALNNTTSDNILRQLLSRPSLNNNGGSPMHRSSPSPNCSPTPPASPAPSHCSSGAATMASSGSGRGTPQHLLHHQQDLHHTQNLHQRQDLHQTQDLHQRQSMHQDVHQRNNQRQGGGRQRPQQPLGPHQSPPSRHNGPADGQQDKNKQQEDRTVQAVTGLSAAAVTVVASGPPLQEEVTEDDMAKLVDALEMHLDGGRRPADASDGSADSDDGDDDDSEQDDDDDEQKAALMALDEMGAVGIQAITLSDVLDVIGKGYRSVSDEEIKKYTEFMLWFANVAKSACPHNGRGSEAPTMDDDDFGVESTICATPSLMKRNQRRKPLKKLGKFLLRALMFILD